MRVCEARWDVCQHFDPVRRHQHVVFDPHAAPSREIGARLDGEDHSRLDRFIWRRRRVAGRLSSRSNPRRFVNLHAQAVARAVPERLGQFMPAKRAPGPPRRCPPPGRQV